MSREKTHSKGGVCTICGKRHPKGRKARMKALKAGTWGGCTMQIKKETATPESRFKDPELRAAKNAQTKERNQQRKEQRQKEAAARNEKWQALTLEQQLEACKKSPYNKSKQIAKIKRQIKERDENNGKSGDSPKSENDSVRRKRKNRPSRRSRKKGGRKVS